MRDDLAFDGIDRNDFGWFAHVTSYAHRASGSPAVSRSKSSVWDLHSGRCRVIDGMPDRLPPSRKEFETMSAYLTSDGLLTTVARDQRLQGKIEDRVIRSRREWEAVASAWPLKQLVAIWNGLPGVQPVQKFTNRRIALERIWRVIAGREPVRRRSAVKPERYPTLFREGSKAAQAYALLVRRHGVTLEELEQLTGWQRHTIRGFLSSSARKHGFHLRSFRRAGERVYQLQEQ